MLPLPFAFLGPSLRSVVGWNACTGRPDGVRRSAEVMGGDMVHHGRLASRQCSELRWVGHPARSGIGLESPWRASPHRTSPRIQARPRSRASRGRLSWLLILEQMQHVLGAQECPIGGVRPSEGPRDGW